MNSLQNIHNKLQNSKAPILKKHNLKEMMINFHKTADHTKGKHIFTRIYSSLFWGRFLDIFRFFSYSLLFFQSSFHLFPVSPVATTNSSQSNMTDSCPPKQIICTKLHSKHCWRWKGSSKQSVHALVPFHYFYHFQNPGVRTLSLISSLLLSHHRRIHRHHYWTKNCL